MLLSSSSTEKSLVRLHPTVPGSSCSSPNCHRRLAISKFLMPHLLFAFLLIPLSIWAPLSLPSVGAQMAPTSPNVDDPEAVIRLLVEANANKDLDTMKKYMGGDPQAIGYTIGGRKFVGWEEFARVMETEFRAVEELIIPITNLQVWQRQDIAWFAMELDYTRVTKSQEGLTSKTIPLRETGVLERRDGTWQLINWHESLQKPKPISAHTVEKPSAESGTGKVTKTLDLGGTWEIQEEDKTYQATLDAKGNGPYTHEQGTFTTTELDGRLWTGTWEQKGNDREGGFEVLLSEDFMTAEGVWWYTRVEQHQNIPPRIHGGSYIFKRLSPTTDQHAKQD